MHGNVTVLILKPIILFMLGRLKQKFQGHSSYIKHVDWSSDSQIVRSNSGDYEILYCKSQN